MPPRVLSTPFALALALVNPFGATPPISPPPAAPPDPPSVPAGEAVAAGWFEHLPPPSAGGPSGEAAAPSTSSACPGDPEALCLLDGRFRVEVEWENPAGHERAGRAVGLTPSTGWFWFFRPANPELFVKVLDGRAVNGHFWVVHGGLSNLGYTLTVTDASSGEQRVYRSRSGELTSAGDVEAFPGDPGAPAGTERGSR